MQKINIEDVKSSFSFSIPIQVRFSDIDGYMHVNNGVFFNYLEHARAAYLHKVCNWDIMKTGTVVANVNLNYLRPIHVLDKPVVYIRCNHIGNTSFILEQIILGQAEDSGEQVFAQSTTTMVSVDMKTMKPVPVPEGYASKMKKGSGEEA